MQIPFLANTRLQKLRLIGVVTVLAMTCGANAYAEEGLTSMRSAGMGGTNVATAVGNGALFINPAGLATGSIYSLEIGYDASIRSRTHRMGISVADSKTNDILAGGFAYTFSIANEGDAPYEARVRDHNIRLGVAIPIIEGHLSLGATGTYLKYAHEKDGERVETKGFSADLGALARVNDKLFIGFSAQDLIYVDQGTGRRKLRTGVATILGPVQINMQWRADIDRHAENTVHHRFGGGLEANIEGFQLRAGYEHLFFNSNNILSVGAGYRSEVVGVDVAFRQYFNDRDRRDVGVSLLIFL